MDIHSFSFRRAATLLALLALCGPVAGCGVFINLIGIKKAKIETQESLAKAVEKRGFAPEDCYRAAPPPELSEQHTEPLDSAAQMRYLQRTMYKFVFYGAGGGELLAYDSEKRPMTVYEEGNGCSGTADKFVDVLLAPKPKGPFQPVEQAITLDKPDNTIPFDTLTQVLVRMDGSPVDPQAFEGHDYYVFITWRDHMRGPVRKRVGRWYERLSNAEHHDVGVYLVNHDFHESWMNDRMAFDVKTKHKGLGVNWSVTYREP